MHHSRMSLHCPCPALWVVNYSNGIVHLVCLFFLPCLSLLSRMTLPSMLFLAHSFPHFEDWHLSWSAGATIHLQFHCVTWVFKSCSASIQIASLQKAGSITVLPLLSCAAIPGKLWPPAKSRTVCWEGLAIGMCRLPSQHFLLLRLLGCPPRLP